MEILKGSSSSSNLSGIVLRLPFGLGLGVPLLFLGLSNDFLGRPLPLFATAGGESSPPFKGTVIVVVCSVRRFFGELIRTFLVFSSLTCSACTVKRIRHGLVDGSCFDGLVGDLLLLRDGGVET